MKHELKCQPPSSASTAKLDMLPRLVTEAGAVVYDVASDPREPKLSDFRPPSQQYTGYRTGFDRAAGPDATAYTVSNPGSENGWFRDRFTTAFDTERYAAEKLQRHEDGTIYYDAPYFETTKWRRGN